MIHWIEITALIFGMGLAALLVLSPRFGPGSRQLLLFLLPPSLAAGIQAFGAPVLELTPQESAGLSYAFVLIAAAGGYFACSYLNRKAKRLYAFFALAAAALLVVLLYAIQSPPATDLEPPEGYIALGAAGYAAAIFLLVISVIVLANLEQILRSATETVRWELKFLLLGIGIIYAAIIYMSSHTLLFPPENGLLLKGAIGLFYCIFLIGCLLITIAWTRSSGRSRIAVSHGAIYSSITLLAVGIYLIASSLIARWANRWGDIGLPAEALIFLLSAIIMAILMLGTSFRHRVRHWIRKNIFAGRYDYRQFWLEATERIRSIDPPEETAAALADIVHRALGAIDISVWIRQWNPNRLNLLSSLGSISDSVDSHVSGIVEKILDISEPLSHEDLDATPGMEAVKEFMNDTKASLLVPLESSNRIVGVLTVGSDRSGRPYDWEAREFLRALAGHAAGEFHKSDLLSTLVKAKEDEAFRTFSTFLLHDLKNFASTLSLIAQNAPKYQNNHEFQKDAFNSVFDTAEKIKRLCNSLRSFSSNLAADKKPVDLNQVVQATADNFNTGLKAHLEYALGNIPSVPADREEVERVLQNLLVNAYEAISGDGIIILKTEHQENTVKLSVEDNGKGMSREFMEKELFLPFHTTKSEGLGIGLFQSKKIMEAHKGSIQVESIEGEGTTIGLIFPVAKEIPED